MVYNLGWVVWNKFNEYYVFDWVVEVDQKMKEWILSGDYQCLINFWQQGSVFDLVILMFEYYILLFYILGLKDKNDEILFFNDYLLGGLLMMMSVKFGQWVVLLFMLRQSGFDGQFLGCILYINYYCDLFS